MDIEILKHQKKEIIKKYGPWTAHNIQLGDNIYTIDNRLVGDEIKLRRIVQILSDIACKPMENLRILDLACLEGLYAVEFAQHGAKVTAIEGREANIEKARFVKDALSLDNLDLHLDDVRNLSRERYGAFDAVLCLGILYHLDSPDVFLFMDNIASVCDHYLILDTHISTSAEEFYVSNGKKYRGKYYKEHSPESSREERLSAVWASLDNDRSFWLTRQSLYNLLTHSGFTTVFECHTPAESQKPDDRFTLLAIKGRPETLLSSQVANSQPISDYPEIQTENPQVKGID